MKKKRFVSFQQQYLQRVFQSEKIQTISSSMRKSSGEQYVLSGLMVQFSKFE